MTEPLLITTTSRDDHQLDMTIQLGPERTANAVHRAARAVAQKARIAGFRPGKAPDATVIRTFGREAVLSEILDDLGEKVFKEALASEKIEPYGRASLEEVKTDPVTFKLVIPLQPTVTLGDYRAVHLELPAVSAGDADVDAVIEQARTARAALDVAARPAQLGDTVVLDITGAVGEETIMDNHDWELVLKAESGWLPGFDEAFVGMSAGEEKSFTLTYPEDSASRYKGQQASFLAKVSAVKSQTKPEVDDEFAKSLGDYENVADMRAKLLARLTENRQSDAEESLNSQAVQALIDGATIAYPPTAVESELDSMMHDFEHRVSDAGYKLEDYFRLQSTTADAYRQRMRPQAEQRFKGRLVVQELTKQEKIEASTEEVQAEIDRMVGLSGEGEYRQSAQDLFASEAGRSIVEQDLVTKKTLARLREIVTTSPAPAQVEAVAAPETDIVQPDQAVASSEEATLVAAHDDATAA